MLPLLLILAAGSGQRPDTELTIPNFSSTRQEVKIKFLGAEYKLERQRVGQQTAYPNYNEKLVALRFQLSASGQVQGESRNLTEAGLLIVDASGRSYEPIQGFPLAAAPSSGLTQEPGRSLSPAEKFTLGRGTASPVFQAVFAVPADSNITEFGFGREARSPRLSIKNLISGLDYYRASDTVPLSEINASQGHWYLGRALDFKLEGHSSKGGMLGEIDGAEGEERFEIATFSVRNSSARALKLYDDSAAKPTFALKLTNGQVRRDEYGPLLTESENGLSDFNVQPDEEIRFRLAFKLQKSEAVKEIVVIESAGSQRSRAIIWPWDGRGTTPWQRAADSTAREETNPFLIDEAVFKGVPVLPTELKKKYPSLFSAVEAAGKFPKITDSLYPANRSFLLPMKEVLVGPTVEGKIFPQGVFTGKSLGKSVKIRALNDSIIVGTLKAPGVNGGAVSAFVKGSVKEASINVKAGTNYTANFAVSVGTKPGIYYAEFEISTGTTRMLVPVRFIIEAAQYSLAISPLFGSGIFLQADSEETSPALVYLKGNKALKVRVYAENLPQGVTCDPVEIILQPNIKTEVPLIYRAAANAKETIINKHYARLCVESTSPNMKSSFDYQIMVEANWVAFSYKGTIGKVSYAGTMLVTGNGDWIWESNGSTNSLINGDMLIQSICFNHPDESGARRYAQLILMLNAKAQSGPSMAAYKMSGNDKWLSDNYYEIADGGISIGLLRYDHGIFSFPATAPWEFDGGAPVEYIKWLAGKKAAYQLKPN